MSTTADGGESSTVVQKGGGSNLQAPVGWRVLGEPGSMPRPCDPETADARTHARDKRVRFPSITHIKI